MKLTLNSPVGLLKGVGKKYIEILNRNGIFSILDLLHHFPIQYIDFSKPLTLISSDQKALYLVEIQGWSFSRGFQRRPSILKIKASLSNQVVYITIFNKPYLTDFFKSHKKMYVYGYFQLRKNTWECNTPLIFEYQEETVTPVIPLYENISTIKSGTIKKIITFALENMHGNYENLPAICLEKYNFPTIKNALKALHFPVQYSAKEIYELKKRFIYSEFFFFQIELQYIRNFFKRIQRKHKYNITPQLKASIKKKLPFELTHHQKKVCAEIVEDLQSEFTMQRLLQGDVGSGKTIVAFITLLIASKNGCQGAFLAPTEILANQHFNNAVKFFKNARIEVLTGSTKIKKRKEILNDLLEGTIDIIFGTHALISDSVKFKNLSMIVIDEQHRFGVSQRAALYYKGKSVDTLVTTATPIPRTMMLTLYNDLSVSTIKTMPEGRQPIITKIIPSENRNKFYTWLKEKIEKREKAYIILPLIEKSEYFSELKDIETEKVYFKRIFKGLSFGIITGQTSSVEKDRILDEFVTGAIRVILATTVIEVGIDVKDATIIVIENADRYGLSQLHQLRGRVGRGDQQSYCYLFPSPNITDNGKSRLKTIASTNNGFKIAETDLKMRGGGIVTGLEQSGYLDFKIANIQDHTQIFKNAQKDAQTVLNEESLQNDYIDNIIKGVQGKLKSINFS